MLLSLDTSTLTLSAALLTREGEVLEHRLVGPPKRQSEILPGELESLLAAHGRTLREVTGFVVGLGPGSFTGLRIGLSTVKGLAWALGVPVAGVSSLAALAHEAGEGPVFACAVVKKGELYVGRYEGGRLLQPEYSLPLAELAEALKAAPGARLVGPALVDYRAPLEALGVPAAVLAEGPLVPSAVSLARLATLPGRFDAQAVFALEPPPGLRRRREPEVSSTARRRAEGPPQGRLKEP